MPANADELVVQRLVVRAVDARRAPRRVPGESARICASSPGPPTDAISCSSGSSSPSTSGGVPHRREDDRAGVDHGAVEVEENDRKAHDVDASRVLLSIRLVRDRGPTAARSCLPRSRGRPSSSGAIRSGGSSSIVPTSVRTMCRRKLSAVISNSSASPRRCHAARETLRTNDVVLRLGRRERAEVVLADKRSAASASRSSSSGRGYHQRTSLLERRRLAPPPDPVAVAARPRRVSRVEVRRHLRRGDDRDVVRQGRVQRSATRSGGGPPSTSTLTTLPSACTPVSVRPATARLADRGKDIRERVAHDALDRAQARLRRPAVEMRCRRTRALASAARQGSLTFVCQVCLMFYVFAT